MSVVIGEVLSSEPIDKLIEQANQEHHLVEKTLGQALDHVIKCGGLLAEIRDQIGKSGGWEDWVEDNFDGGRVVASYYMRISEYQDLVVGLPNVSQAMKSLRGMPALRRSGTNKYSEEVREEARALTGSGMSRREVSSIIGVSRQTVDRWVDPEALRRHRDQVRKAQAARREEARRKKEEAKQRAATREARRVGGALAESYSLAYKLEAPLALAQREASDPKVRKILTEAIRLHHKMLDDVVEALGLS